MCKETFRSHEIAKHLGAIELLLSKGYKKRVHGETESLSLINQWLT